jgi:DNA-binding NarL/FixJ family response regulator
VPVNAEVVRVLSHGHPLFRAGLSWLLRSAEDFEEVAAVESTDVLTDTARLAGDERLRADVAVVDLDLPGDAGFATVRELRRRLPVLAVATADTAAAPAVLAGAQGFLTKIADPAEIRLALHTLARGMVVLGPGARPLLDRLRRAVGTGPFAALTAREHEVLDLMAGGMDNCAIARNLRISGKTVRNHVCNILAKLQVADRPQAIVRARDAGLGSAAGVLGRTF